METIFDHNPKADELRYLTGGFSQERYLEGLTEDDALAALSMLFAMRDDPERADAYSSRIQDDELRFDLRYNDVISSSNASNAV